VGQDVARRLASAAGGGAAELAGLLVGYRCERSPDGTAGIGDAGAVCVVLEPGGVRRERMPVRVELTGTWTRGRTLVGGSGGSGAPVDVCLAVDAHRYAGIWVQTVGGGFR
jgi:pyrimidine-specific ribonucleoside hydrolase